MSATASIKHGESEALDKSFIRPLRRADTAAQLPASFPRSAEAAIVDPLQDAEWDDWISSHPGANIFHSAAWARVLHHTYGHRPCYLRLSAQAAPLALVPMMEVQTLFTSLRGVCLPFSDYCAPLLLTDFGKELVVEKLRQIARERDWTYFEVRDGSLMPENAPVSRSYYAHTLNLNAGGSAVRANFASSAQRAMRKAERSQLSAVIRTEPEAMDQFYKLHVRTRRKHGVPVQPRGFFDNIQRYIINNGLGFIVSVERNGHAAAAAMFFKWGRQAIYKFGASDERALELRPNNLAMSCAIDYLARSGAQTLHFGRTDINNEGLRRFKLSFGATEEQICYGKFNISADNWVSTRNNPSTLHNRVFRALPGPVNRMAGVLLYPHLD